VPFMKITGCELLHQRWQGPLELRTALGQWSSREGLLLRLTTDSGKSGLGEASPLPGYSRDTLESCERALQSLDFGAAPLSAGGEALLDWVAMQAPLGDSPAARFAVEMATLALIDTASESTSLPGTALPGQRAPSPSAALLANSSRMACLSSAEAAFARGLRTFKLKLGRPSAWEEELAQLSALRLRFGSTVAVRLDANGAFAPLELEARLQELGAFGPEFLEEPCGLAALAAHTEGGERALPVKLALDESLQALVPQALPPWLEAFSERGGLRALVLKPMALGGIRSCQAWAKVARRWGVGCVVSHLFGGPLALAWERRLSIGLGDPELADGLDWEPRGVA
jgi:o-succinylbenzoate synthase